MSVRVLKAVGWVGGCRSVGPLIVCAAVLAGCDAQSPVAPSGPPAARPVPTTHTGPVTIEFLGATPSPGATVTGCGADISGCLGTVRMQFLLRAPAAGPVLDVRAFLHATNLLACLSAQTGPFQLARGDQQIVIVFDRAGDCAVPLTIEHLAVVVEGPAEVASRQAWSLRYSFAR